MEKFGEWYIYAEWQEIMLHVFALSEENDGGVAAAVKATMDAHRIVLPSINLSPGPFTSQAMDVAHPQSDASNAGVKRKASCDARPTRGGNQPSLQRPSKHTRHTVHHFIDVEAQVDSEMDTSEEEEGVGDFVDPDDDEDLGLALPRPHRPIGPVSIQSWRPSTYRRAIDAIADHYAQIPDHQPGPNHNGEASDEETTKDPPPLMLLDSAGIWDSIRKWMFGKLIYETLLDTIDFQYDHDPKIQYWKDFLSTLVFQVDLEKREELFMSISLAEHVCRLSNYQSRNVIHSDPSPRASPLPAYKLSPHDGLEKMWIVNIVPPAKLKQRSLSKLYRQSME
ncbi:hypothetical protein HD554DRAFT_2035460 [Boletus coccyginus]|nr:hypothetical protein HD554DRAFT_2035460 [Boletus coccyginus]